MKPLNVLVVEDNVEQIELLKRKLSKLVVPAELQILDQGETALEYLKTTVPDLILLDLNLPGQHGLEILKQINELLGKAAPPVVIVSATDKAEDKAACYHAGAVCFLAKPYNEELLNQVIFQLRATNRLKIA